MKKLLAITAITNSLDVLVGPFLSHGPALTDGWPDRGAFIAADLSRTQS